MGQKETRSTCIATSSRGTSLYDFLQRLRDGKNTEENWQILRQKYSRISMDFKDGMQKASMLLNV
eukprot:2241204-Ditylum_brightwellii.AAC.1